MIKACPINYTVVEDKESFDRDWCEGLTIRPLYRMRIIAKYECINKEVDSLYIENYSDLFFNDDEYSYLTSKLHCIHDGLILCNSEGAQKITHEKAPLAWRCAEIIFSEWQVAT